MSVIVIDGVRYEFRHTEVSAVDTGELRRATGMSFRKLMESAKSDADIDVIAALVWLSRRQNGEPDVAYDTVAASIGYGSAFDFESGEDVDDAERMLEAVDSPEA